VSGFGGIVRAVGGSAAFEGDRKHIERMALRLPFRTFSVPQTWSHDGANFCFTLLKTGPARQANAQPVTLDQQTWLIGDVRLDGRDDLISQLNAFGEESNPGSTDEELVLRAWRRWGESGSEEAFCKILEGDFSFALWRPKIRQLKCFRSLMGSRSFFYARQGEVFCFSNALESLREVPWISNEFDYHYLGDYLLNGWCPDLERTACREIKRLAPGHMLTYTGETLTIERFSKLPIEEPLRYKKDEEYIEHYLELVKQAVRERLPKEGAVVFMSGGLDSTTVAATASQILKQTTAPSSILAITTDYQPLYDDQESHWASLAAQHMGIALQVLQNGEFLPYTDWESLEFRLAEPLHEPYLVSLADQYRKASLHARVALTGCGGDDVLLGNAWPYFVTLLSRFQIRELCKTFGSYLFRNGAIPPMRAGIRTRLRRLFRFREAEEPYPSWLNQEFERKYGLRERWKEIQKGQEQVHPLHPQGYALLSGPFWPNALEEEEAVRGNAPVETRAPLLDGRLLRFLLRVPPVPWCANKQLLRRATTDLLPDSIRMRPKSPLMEDAVQLQIEAGRWSPLPKVPVSSWLYDLIDKEKWVACLRTKAGSVAWGNHYPLSLDVWLKGLEKRIWTK
jgi:asparagine synthase (glutamine-hydrolysing)